MRLDTERCTEFLMKLSKESNLSGDHLQESSRSAAWEMLQLIKLQKKERLLHEAYDA
jgi:hypothetical protein